MGRLVVFLFLLVSSYTISYSQVKIYGVLTDSTQAAVARANIVLRDSLARIHTYVYSDENGSFSLEVKALGKYQLSVNSLGMLPYSKSITVNNLSESIEENIKLASRVEVLKEVFIESERPVYKVNRKPDTTLISVAEYLDGSEFTVEQLLSKMPGIQVLSDGSIQVDGQEVEKLMVEDDDFFGKGYKLLSKNMPAHPIKDIEILRNYSENKLLKGIASSSKVALNLKLKEDAKRVWFGSLEATKGNQSFYAIKANLMNFGKKNKYYLLGFSQNLGEDNTEDLAVFVSSLSKGSSYNPVDKRGGLLGSYTPYLQGISAGKSKFNKQSLSSLNAILNPSKTLKIHPMFVYNEEQVNFYSASLDQIHTQDLSFTNTKTDHLNRTNDFSYLKVGITYDISVSQMLESITIMEVGSLEDASTIVFNSDLSTNALNTENKYFEQELKYTNKLTSSTALEVKAKFSKQESRQIFSSKSFEAYDFFPELPKSDVFQQQAKRATESLDWIGIATHRFKNKSTLKYSLGYNFLKENLDTQLYLIKEGEPSYAPSEFFNQTNYIRQNTYTELAYSFKYRRFSFSADLNLEYLDMSLRNIKNNPTQNVFYLEPRIGLDFRISPRQRLSLNYTQNFSTQAVVDLYENYVLTGFQRFAKGLQSPEALRTTSLRLYYQFGDWVDDFFGNLSVFYTHDQDFISSHTIIQPEASLTESIFVKNRQHLAINSRWDYFIDLLKTNLQLEFGWNTGDFKNSVNYSDLRRVQSDAYTYGISIATNIRNTLSFNLGTKWEYKEIKSSGTQYYTDNSSYFNLISNITKRMRLQVSSERYKLGNIAGDNTYYFIDASLSYSFPKDRFSLELAAKNVLDNNEFKRRSITDIGVYTTTHRLLPQRFLLTAKYRF